MEFARLSDVQRVELCSARFMLYGEVLVKSWSYLRKIGPFTSLPSTPPSAKKSYLRKYQRTHSSKISSRSHELTSFCPDPASKVADFSFLTLVFRFDHLMYALSKLKMMIIIYDFTAW